MRSVVLCSLTMGLLGILCGCGAPEGSAPVRVAAAASLADVLPEIARGYVAQSGVAQSGVAQSGGQPIEARFGASSTLARQIRDGAESDVLIAADPRWVDELVSAGLAEAGSRQVIATNRLVAIVPAGATSIPSDARALASLPHLALAGPEVPAGAHARAALERAGVPELAPDRTIVAPDVRGALAWVAQGEAEAAIVYATDAAAEPRVRVAFEFDPTTHDPIRYEAVALTPAGRAFVAFLRSDGARSALARAGFGLP